MAPAVLHLGADIVLSALYRLFYQRHVVRVDALLPQAVVFLGVGVVLRADYPHEILVEIELMGETPADNHSECS